MANYRPDKGKWYAEKTYKGERIYGGYFDTKERAEVAEAELEYRMKWQESLESKGTLVKSQPVFSKPDLLGEILKKAKGREFTCGDVETWFGVKGQSFARQASAWGRWLIHEHDTNLNLHYYKERK